MGWRWCGACWSCLFLAVWCDRFWICSRSRVWIIRATLSHRLADSNTCYMTMTRVAWVYNVSLWNRILLVWIRMILSMNWIWPRFGSETSSLIDESDDAEDHGCTATRDVQLSLSRLESLHTLSSSGNVEPTSSYAKNGMCKKRIKRVLKEDVCSCRCKVPFAILYRVCVTFWSLGKPAQDALLWTMQTEGGHRQKHWHIEGGAKHLITLQ